MNAEVWVAIPRDEAERHPLFGIRGWFRAFLILCAIDLIASLALRGSDILGIFGKLGTVMAVSPVLAVLLATLPVILVMQIYVLFLGVAGERGFRRWATATLVLLMVVRLGLLVAISTMTQALDEQVLLKTFMQIGIVGALLAYVSTSRRVRVTCEWTVRRDDPCLEAVQRRREEAALAG